MISVDILLSGFIGAIVAVMFSILYQEYRVKREKEYSLARERLGKIYGPLLLIYEANREGSTDETFYYDNEKEGQIIDDLLLRYYYLIEDERKKPLLDIYSHRRFSDSVSNRDIINAIKSGYYENLKKVS